MKEKTLPMMMNRPERLSQLLKTDMHQAGAGVVGVASINPYLLFARQLPSSLLIGRIIGCHARWCLSVFGKPCTFLVFV